MLDELKSWDDELLLKTAEELGIPNPAIDADDPEKLPLAIIDASAEITAKEVVNSVKKRKGTKTQDNGEAEEAQPKKRGRKPKAKEDKTEKSERPTRKRKPPRQPRKTKPQKRKTMRLPR